jgi:hypothetical protein
MGDILRSEAAFADFQAPKIPSLIFVLYNIVCENRGILRRRRKK